jgi:hypothetical protein
MDALKGLAWKDDCQVCLGYAPQKWYCSTHDETRRDYDRPHVKITIKQLSEEEAQNFWVDGNY